LKRRYFCPRCAKLQNLLPSMSQRRASQQARETRALDQIIFPQGPTDDRPLQEASNDG
jgi:hypothetical protein